MLENIGMIRIRKNNIFENMKMFKIRSVVINFTIIVY